jgi:integrase
MADKRYFADRTLKALAPAKAGNRYEIWDTKLPGFGVRVGDEPDTSRPGKAGRIAFILYARFPRQTRPRRARKARGTDVTPEKHVGNPHPTRRVLGQYGPLSLEEARNKAADWLNLIRKGIDPKETEEEARQAALRQQDQTFAAVAEKFIDHIKAQKEQKADEVERDLRRHFIKPWGSRPVASITHHDVAAVIDSTLKRATKKQSKRARAHNLFGHVRRLFRWAVPLHVGHSPCALLSPKRMIGERVKRDRVLTDDELRALWLATERMGYPYGPMYRLLALTGLRLSECCEASWSEFDFKKRLWTIPAIRMKKTGKAAKPHVVPITDAMLEILESLPRLKDGEFLFSSQSGKAPLKASHFSKPKRRLDAAMLAELRALAEKNGGDPDRVTLPEWDNHDIRRTVRTNLSALRIPEEVREAVLAHVRPGIKGSYDFYEYLDEKRDALTLWAARLRSIVEPAPANVVELARVRA